MKNLNIEKANKPNLTSVKSASRTFIYSLCMALFLLTSSLSSKAQTGSDMAHADTTVVLTTFATGFDWYMNGFYNDGSGLSNNWGDSNSGNDYWIKLTITKSGYLQVYCGTVSNDSGFDCAVHLVNDTGSYDLSYGDDGGGSYGTGGIINYYVGPGVYYVVLDGTDKPGWSIVRNGGVGIDFSLTY